MCEGKARKAALIFLALISGGTASAATQTIAFDAISGQILGISPFVIVAQASSGLPVSFASGTPAVCKNSGSLVMLLSAGTCSITASQAGNSGFNAATPVTRSFSVSQAKPSGSFTAAAGGPFGAGQAPHSVASADFNGDGVLDLAIANSVDNNVTILLGNGSGGFTADPSGPFSAGTQPWSVVVGDFNADGHADIAVASVSSNDVTVLLGNGAGAFTAAAGSPIAIGTLPFSLIVGDFNGDGIQDLVTVNANDNSLTVLLGNGAGGFTATSARITVGANPSAAAVGDFNGDGIQDLAVSNLAGQSVTVLLGNGSGGFAQVTGSPFALPHQPGSIAVGDFNGDGIQDLAAECGATFSVLLGDGTGKFTDAFDSPPVTGNSDVIRVGDFNGDGNQDLITVDPMASEITLLPGNGETGFTVATGSPYATGASPTSMAVADFNGDGVLDVATANFQANNVTVLLGFVVGTSPQTITFGSLGTVTYGVAPFTVSASTNSRLAVSFASASSAVCTVAGSTVTVVGGGTCSIVASQAGNATFAAAATVTQSFTVNPQPQTVTFGPLSNVVLGIAPFTISATASSGLGVTFFSGTESVCTVSGNTVTILAAGTCSITAIQFGNSTIGYASAMQSFTVTTTCSFSLNQGSYTVGSAGGTVSAVLTTQSGCTWTVTNNNPSAITITAGASGTGSGTITMTVAANLSSGSQSFYLPVGTTQITIGQAGAALQLMTVTPCRVIDTRNANGPFGGPYIAGGTSRTITIPSSSCGIPATAVAYSLNITVVPRTATLGYLTVWPNGQPQPYVSTLNSLSGLVLANAAIVPAGTSGAVSAYATDDTDLVVDINGYFVPPASNTLQFYPVTPCRVLDTRNASGTFGGPSIAGGTSRSFPIPSSACGVPSNAAAYSLNVTVAPQGDLGYITVWPTGQTQPYVSTLNSSNGTVLANAAIVPAGTGGAASFYASNTTDLVVDINGYFAAPGSGLNFYTATPCRLADTRTAAGPLGGPSVGAGATRTFPLPLGACGLPGYPTAQAYSLNMTVVPQGVLGYLTVWPAGGAQPYVSTLNAENGQIAANAAIVPSSNGSIDVFAANTTDVVIDTDGFFGP